MKQANYAVALSAKKLFPYSISYFDNKITVLNR